MTMIGVYSVLHIYSDGEWTYEQGVRAYEAGAH